MPTVSQIPFVDYLVLDQGDPHLTVNECTTCGARYFDRRNACAGCFGTQFTTVALPTTGVLRTFSIVAFAAPGVDVPFVAGVVDCGGTSVRANIVNVEPLPENIHTGTSVRLVTHSLGVDSGGVEAVGFGFEPAT